MTEDDQRHVMNLVYVCVCECVCVCVCAELSEQIPEKPE